MKKSITDQTLPHFTVSAFIYDFESEEIVLLKRGAKVRSVPNCLSIPSGLLEHSESFEVALARELEEEIGLKLFNPEKFKFQTIYRNIPEDGFDWVIGIWSIEIPGVSQLLINKEPDKHDWVRCVKFPELMALCDSHPEQFAPNLLAPLHRVACRVFYNF